MQQQAPASITEAQPVALIPYRPEQDRGAGDYAVVLAVTLLALVALVAVVAWLQRRGALPFQPRQAQAQRTRVVERLRIARATEISIVEHDGTRIAVVESPRGVALTVLPARPDPG